MIINILKAIAIWLFWHGQTQEQYLAMHDEVHRYVAKLEPIEIQGHQVDGISGVIIPEFHADYQVRVAAYDGMLDEYRVQTHIVVTQPGVYSVGAYVLGCLRMLLDGINPIKVLLDHIATLAY